MWVKNLKEQQVMDPPAIETKLWGIQIAHPTLGTDQTDPKIFLKALGQHRIPVGGLLFTLLTEVELWQKLRVSQGARWFQRVPWEGAPPESCFLLPQCFRNGSSVGKMGFLLDGTKRGGSLLALYSMQGSPGGWRSLPTSAIDPGWNQAH